MYSKMLRQLNKGSLISISSESLKIHLLIKVLYRPIWFNVYRQYFLFHALNVSLCYFKQCNLMSLYLGLYTWNVSALPMLVYLCKGSLTYRTFPQLMSEWRQVPDPPTQHPSCQKAKSVENRCLQLQINN